MRAALSILTTGLGLSVASATLAASAAPNASQTDNVRLTASAPMSLHEFSTALSAATGKAVLIGLTPANEYRRYDRGHRVRIVNWTGPLPQLLNSISPRFGLQWAEEDNAILLFDAPSVRPKAPAPAVTKVEVPASAAKEAPSTPQAPLAPVVLHTHTTAAPPADNTWTETERRAAFVQSVAPVIRHESQAAHVAAVAPAAVPSVPQASAPRFTGASMPPVVTSSRPDARPLPALEAEPARPKQVGEDLPPVNLVTAGRVTLDPKEAHGVRVANQWKTNPSEPRQGEDGSVKYLYGATLPTLVCAPLEVCAIKLQPGEVVNDVHAGDTARWRISPASSGTGPEATTLVVVKPTDAGLATNLFISTDRRTYTIKLISTQKSWIPLLSFDYPEDVTKAWSTFRQRQAEHVNATTLPTTGQSITNLDFSFKMTGDRPSWKPQRIYTDGVRTYIQFPSAKFPIEAPALVALGKSSGVFADPTTQMINYRVQGDLFIVDQVIDRAALISGAGNDQTRVIIEYKGR